MHNRGLGSWLLTRARISPHRVALMYGGQSVTYAQLAARCTAVARRLTAIGVNPGDRVAYLGANHSAFVETMLATHLAAGVFVPLNFRLTTDEVAYMLTDSGTRVLVYGPPCASIVAKLPSDVAAARVAVDSDDDREAHCYDDWVSTDISDHIDVSVDGSDLALILYTSGTTGRPKGAMLTHDNLLWNTINALIGMDTAADDVTLISSPLFHVGALGQALLPTLIKGAAALLIPSWDVDTCFDLIEQEKVTFMFGVPTMFTQLAQSPRWPDADLSSLRTLLCAGSAVPMPLIEIYQQRGLSFCQGYGLTETAPGATLLETRESADHAGSAGPPMFFCEVKVRAAHGDDAIVGEAGEILIKGPNVSSGYWNNAVATAKAFTPAGWFRSGDIGVVDRHGYLTIVDRIKDMYISGGENVYPAEVEEATYACPHVAEAAVIGVADDKWGEVGHAFVVARPGQVLDSETLRTWLSQRLAKYKIPKHYTFLDELPKTGSGKADKRVLRNRG
ncbi:MAG: acyl-CoA synthetase [Mycobacterium sp.]